MRDESYCYSYYYLRVRNKGQYNYFFFTYKCMYSLDEYLLLFKIKMRMEKSLVGFASLIFFFSLTNFLTPEPISYKNVFQFFFVVVLKYSKFLLSLR